MIPYKFLSVLVMPTDYCNMNCIYCFNSRKTHQTKKKMSFETLQQVFSTTIPYYDEVKFIWHGGEPLSMGVDFYKKVVEFQKKININGCKINNSIQSNLTLLDEKYARFLLENGFKIGGSFDGTQNELTRYNTSKILFGRDLVIKCGGTVGFICVVQSKNIDCLIEDYEWFKSRKINYTLNQYLASPPHENDELYVPAEHYAKRICEFFDYWAQDSKCNITISYFDDFVDYFLYGDKRLCAYNSCLGKHIGVQYDGTIYNCNRDFPAEYSYGNVYDYTDIHECFESSGFRSMVEQAVKRRNDCKETCEIYDFCTGGCNSCAYIGGDISKKNDYVCESLLSIYHHIENKFEVWKNMDSKERVENLNPVLAKKLLHFIETRKKNKKEI